MTLLTARQTSVLRYIRRFIATNHFAPSCDEIARELGFASSAAVADNLDRLQRKGCIRWTYWLFRSIELTEDDHRPRQILQGFVEPCDSDLAPA